MANFTKEIDNDLNTISNAAQNVGNIARKISQGAASKGAAFSSAASSIGSQAAANAAVSTAATSAVTATAATAAAGRRLVRQPVPRREQRLRQASGQS